jgi:fatty-acyl-CoA synthase
MIVPLTPIRFLYRSVDIYGKKVGVISGPCRFTYAQFGERVERMAAGLLAEGVGPGDRVAYLSFNNNQLLEGYYAAPLIRAIVMPLNVRLTPPELIEILSHSGARMLIFESEFSPLVDIFRNACRSIARYVTIDGPVPQADLTFEELLSHGRIDRPDVFSFDENEVAELFYTSGSTGTPKGVMLSHRTIYLHALSTAASNRHNEAEVELHTIPLFHANGWGKPQIATMNGSRHVMVRRFESAQVLRLIEEEQVTTMSLVPVMANALLNCPDLDRFNKSSLQEIFIGGAASSPELIRRMEQAFACHVLAGYGLTETSPVASSARIKSTVHFASEEDRLFRMSTAGWPVIGCEIRVVDSHMCDVPRDMKSIGEVVIRGDNVMDGYYKEPEATKVAIVNGWLHTGDMAVWDEENYIHIVDRKKDIIISGGENISSIEVEKAIFAHAAVLECAVVAAPDSKWGEVPAAIVVLKPGHQLCSDDLIAFLQKQVAKFKLPGIVRFVEGPLPKTGTGKILKRELREAFWAGKERRVHGI